MTQKGTYTQQVISQDVDLWFFLYIGSLNLEIGSGTQKNPDGGTRTCRGKVVCFYVARYYILVPLLIPIY